MLDFSGRSRRSAYWWFALFTSLGGVAFGMIDEYIDVPGMEDWSVFLIIFCFVVVLPDLSLGIRRLHDIGRKEGLYVVWILFSYGSLFLPEPSYEINVPDGEAAGLLDLFGYGVILNAIVDLITFCLMIVIIFLLTRDSQKGLNIYGPNPKGIGNTDVFS